MEINGKSYWYFGRGNLVDEDTLSYGHLSATPIGSGPELILPSRLGGSDYSDSDGGDSRRQYDAWMEAEIPGRGMYWWRVSGGHGTFGIAIRADVLDDDTEWAVDAQDTIDAIRSTVEELDSDYGIADENAEHEELTELTVRSLVEDRFHEQLLYVLINNGAVIPAQFEALFDVNDQTYIDGGDTAVDALVAENAIQAYFELSDVFSVYPRLEGSGGNVNAVPYVSEWIKDLNDIFAEMNAVMPFPDEENTIASAMLMELLTNKNAGEMFRYEGPFNHALRQIRDLRFKSQEARAVYKDQLEELGIEAATKRLLDGQLPKMAGVPA